VTRAERLQRTADAWNAAHPVGTVVRYWTGEREGKPTGESPTRAPAAVMSGHVSVWIVGCAGGVNLSHVEVSTADAETQYVAALAALSVARANRHAHELGRGEAMREAARLYDEETVRLARIVDAKQEVAMLAAERLKATQGGGT
jgi:hypothetical protein